MQKVHLEMINLFLTSCRTSIAHNIIYSYIIIYIDIKYNMLKTLSRYVDFISILSSPMGSIFNIIHLILYFIIIGCFCK